MNCEELPGWEKWSGLAGFYLIVADLMRIKLPIRNFSKFKARRRDQKLFQATKKRIQNKNGKLAPL